MGGEEQPRRRGFLGFFGLETREKAGEVALWALPYLGVLVAGLAGLSWFVQKFMPIPAWVHALAILLAILYFFFFLARLRQMALEAEEPRRDA